MNVGTIAATIQFVVPPRTATLAAEVEVGSLGATATKLDNEAMRYLIDNSLFNHKTGCWHWVGTKAKHGYGTVGPNWVYKAYARGAHRASKMVFHGWVPENSQEQIRHQCIARDCINPFHVTTGTAAQNCDDRLKSGDPKRKLSDDKVQAIWRLLYTGLTYPVIAARYGVHRTMIGHIKTGKAFAWVPRP